MKRAAERTIMQQNAVFLLISMIFTDTVFSKTFILIFDSQIISYKKQIANARMNLIHISLWDVRVLRKIICPVNARKIRRISNIHSSSLSPKVSQISLALSFKQLSNLEQPKKKITGYKDAL
ncbi:MAG: hypothetical protein P9L92_20175 [Candidatus Electryonea clarkiae]|nr:hypothetical protein [Candidatus Electryonea clarkiae]MDP8285068.1 hypothetical protein [Candidatus Electryonea clarkiae]